MIRVLDIFIRKFESKDAECLRQTRNESNKYLINTKFITKEEQKIWLASNDFNKNAFYCVECQDDVVGFLNIKTYCTEDGIETGILFKREYHNHHAPATAVIAMTYYLFNSLSTKMIKTRVHRENKNAINMNLILGFKFLDFVESDFIEMYLKSSDFMLIYNRSFKKLKLKFEDD